MAEPQTTGAMPLAAPLTGTEAVPLVQGGKNRRGLTSQLSSYVLSVLHQADLSANVYADTATGLAATAEGDYFNVPSASADVSLVLYQKVSGAAVEIKQYPSAERVNGVVARVTTAEAGIAALEAIDAGGRLTTAEATLDEAVPKVDRMFGHSLYRDGIGEFMYQIADATGRVPWGLRPNGDTYMSGAEMPVPRDSSRVLWGVSDAVGQVAFGVQRDGSTLVATVRVVVDIPARDAAPYAASIRDAAGNALLSWSGDGEVDFLPSATLLDRMAVGGTVAPDAGGYYTYNLRSDGTHTFRTVQSPDQSVYETVSLDASSTGTQVACGPGVIEGLIFTGQSNAGRDGAGGTVITDAKYPSHVFGFSASDPNTSVSLQWGGTAVDAASLTDLLPIRDYPATTSHVVGNLVGSVLEWRRRLENLPTPGTFIRTDWYGGQPITSFVRGTTVWTNIMTSAAKMKAVCANYGRAAQVRGLVWIQGETTGWAGANYGEDLNALLDDMLPEIKLQADQPTTPFAIVVQTNSNDAAGAGGGVSLTNLYQLSVCRERYGRDTIMAGPMYQCPVLVSDGIHATPIGKMILAETIANAYLAGKAFKPLWPTSATRVGNKITVNFDIPGDGLAFDSDWVKTVSNYGFSYFDSTSSAAISSVAIVGDTVEITLSATPTGTNQQVRYGYGSDADVDGWSPGRGLLYSPTTIPSYYASLGYVVPETLRHYCVKFNQGVT